MVGQDLAARIVIVVGKVLVDKYGALGSGLLLAREEILNLEGGDLVVPARDARPFMCGGHRVGGARLRSARASETNFG